MKNSVGKPYKGKLQVRFDEGGADSLPIIIIFMCNNNRVSYQALLYAKMLLLIAD
jgi:hypothetical protein